MRNAISEMSRLKYQTGYMERSIDSRHNCIVIHVSVINECIRVSKFSEGKSIEEKNKKEIKQRSHHVEHHTDSVKEAKQPMS